MSDYASLFPADGDDNVGVLTVLEVENDRTHPLDEEESRLYERDKGWMNLANLVAGVFHSVSFLGALILSVVFRKDIYRATISTTVTKWDGTSAQPELDILGSYTLSWTILPFPVLTALFHFASLLPPLRNHLHRIVLHRGKRKLSGWNWLRWVEYSITASLMTWTIAQLAGVTDLATLFCFVALNAMMQLAGGLGHEWSNIGWSHNNKRAASWWLFALGFLPFATIWATVVAYFAVQARSASPPNFVYAIIITMFFLFLSFTVPFLLRYARWQSFLLRTNISYELSFIFLSFISKATLDWLLVIGSITRGN